MTYTPAFRRPGLYPDGIDAHSGIALVQQFRQWIGEDFLAQRTRAYDVRMTTSHSVDMLRIRARQPLIEAFQRFDRLRASERILPHQITDDIKELMGIAAKAVAVTPTLTDEQANDQRHKLLNFDGQHAPQLLEWTVAANVIRTHDAWLAWSQVGGPRAPEFIGRANGVEFEVECKYQTEMTGHFLGTTEAHHIAGVLLDRLHAQNLQGRLRLDVDPTAATQQTRELAADVAGWLDAGVAAGPVDARFESRARLTGSLRKHDGEVVDVRDWTSSVARDLSPGARGFQRYNPARDAISDPLGLIIFCPLKPMDQLFTDLQTQRFDDAALQCSGERGAILVFAWENVLDPHIFAKPGLFKTLMGQTLLKHPHVSRISMLCDSAPTDAGTLWQNSVEAYTEINPAPQFPEAIPFMALDIVTETVQSRS